MIILETEKQKKVLELAKNRCILFTSDAAAENIKFAKDLVSEHGFSKLVHTTCLAHGLHNVLKTLKTEYERLHTLIMTVKKIYSKATKRRIKFRKINPGMKLPVRYVQTRWVSWVNAVKYFNEKENREAIIAAMEDLMVNDKNAKEQAQLVLNLLADETIVKEINLISTEYEIFIKITKALERKSTTLEGSIKYIEHLRTVVDDGHRLQKIPQRLKQKFEEVFAKNVGYMMTKKFVQEKIATGMFLNMSEEEINSVLKGNKNIFNYPHNTPLKVLSKILKNFEI